MAINIRTNLPALSAQRNLDVSSNKLSTSYQRLSSGLRINRASDDAAGLAIAENLKAGSSTATVAMRNANDGISVITIADQAASQIANVLNRMAELATQSSNGVIDNVQRSALQNEFVSLASEIERIAVTTKFNGLPLLDGQKDLSFQIGFDGSSTSQLSYGSVDIRLAGIGLASVGSSATTFSIIGAAGTEVESQVAARSALDAIQVALTSVNQKRGGLGALENRLEVTINNLQVARENFKAAESRIRDLDVATEAAELTRLNILQQAGAAVLAQANQAPQLALQLLGR
ncbi:MAG: flagellin [Pseudomonadota bacterium]|jgi:flagellin